MDHLVGHPGRDPERHRDRRAGGAAAGRLLTDASAGGTAPGARSRVRGALWLAALAAAAWVVWRHGPDDPLLPFACPFHAATGWHCPGCGTMRALHAIVHGRFAQGAGHNPLAVVVIPAILVAFASDVRRAFTGRPLPLPDLPHGVVRAVPWALLAYTVARNLPWAPFTALAP